MARLRQEGLEIDSLAFMGGAVRTDEFLRVVAPHLGSGVKRFTTFDLAERYEQDDTCDVGGKVFYHKSLLYLVARGLESGPDRRPAWSRWSGSRRPSTGRSPVTDGACGR